MISWQSLLENLYDASHLTESFYLKHAFLVLVACAVLERETLSLDSVKLVPVQHFASCFPWLQIMARSRQLVRDAVAGLDLPRHDIFYKVYPLVVSHSTQHGSGEYYTPVSLARLMVSERYVPGMRALDPSCGSGTFLVEMVNAIASSHDAAAAKARAISSLAGADKNPLAIFMTAINMLLALHHAGLDGIFSNLHLDDTLFPSNGPVCGDLDLVIGNPPWIVLGGIENAAYKERLKRLAMDLGIYVGGKNASNLEIAALFFYKFLDHVKPGRWIFFLLPNSIITGSQHDKARVFNGFDAIQVWRFSRQPFKIHSICMAGRKSSAAVAFTFQFPFTSIEVHEDGRNELVFTKAGEELYEPGTMKMAGAGSVVESVGRLIPADKKKHILPRGKSPYARLFYKGAQIFPRTMFFVDIDKESDEGGVPIVDVRPSSLVQAKKLGRWNFYPYEKDSVESQYIFKIAKSTFIVPFQLVQALDAFLPCVLDEKLRRIAVVEDTNLLPRAAAHVRMLQSAFKDNLKPGAAHTSLREIINYQNCLANPRQMANLKVAYNGGGSIVKGALIEGNVIVDYSMFYCPVESKREGYYLSAYLNTPSLTESVKLIGSTGFHGSLRNIVKHPLDFPWPIFDPNDAMHVEVARLGQRFEEVTRAIMVQNHCTRIGGEDDDATRMKLQNAIFSDDHVIADLDALDSLVRQVIDAGVKNRE
jgi:methylase of polypeptide subunit release factors